MRTAVQQGPLGGSLSPDYIGDGIRQEGHRIQSLNTGSEYNQRVTGQNIAGEYPGITATPLFPELVSRKIRPARPERVRRKESQLVHEVALDLLEKSVSEIASACGASRSGRDMLRAAFRTAQAAGQDYIDLSVTQWARAASVSSDTIHRQANRFREAGAGPLVSLMLMGSKGRSLESVWRIQAPTSFADALSLTSEGRLPGHQRTRRGQRTARAAQTRIHSRQATFFNESVPQNPQIAPLTEVLSESLSDSQKGTSENHPHPEVVEVPTATMEMVSQKPAQEIKTQAEEEHLVAKALLGIQGFEPAGAKAVARSVRGDNLVAQAIHRYAPQLLKALEAEPNRFPVQNPLGILSHRITYRRNWVLKVAKDCERREIAFAEERKNLELMAQKAGVPLPALPDAILALVAAWQRVVAIVIPTDSPGFLDHFDNQRRARYRLIDALKGHLGEAETQRLEGAVKAKLVAAGIPEGLVMERAFDHHLGREVLQAAGLENLPQ